MLDDLRIERYARHILLREVGGVGQERILSAEVRIDGLDEAGCWAATYLVMAGVGRLRLVDARPVPAGGLLPLLPASAAGLGRDLAAARAIPALNPDTRIEVEVGESGEGAAGLAAGIIGPTDAGWDAVHASGTIRPTDKGWDAVHASGTIRRVGAGGDADAEGSTIRLGSAGGGAYLISRGGSVGGWVDNGHVCRDCIGGIQPGDATAAALAGSLAASEILAAILTGQPRARGLRTMGLGESTALAPCLHHEASRG